jgi:hypothetical protein
VLSTLALGGERREHIRVLCHQKCPSAVMKWDLSGFKNRTPSGPWHHILARNTLHSFHRHRLSFPLTPCFYLNPRHLSQPHSPLAGAQAVSREETGSMAPGEREREAGPAKSALRKVRTATLVINLARGWQQWANENSTKQAQEPAGWLPGATHDLPNAPKEAGPYQHAPKTLSPKPDRDGEGQHSEEATEVSHIKRKEVTRTVVSKAYERGGDVNYLSHRYENDGGVSEAIQPENDIDRILLSHDSPTRRRKCTNLVSELTKGWKVMEQEEPTWKSDSVDTEDSGYGGDMEERPEQDAAPVAPARIKRPLLSQ